MAVECQISTGLFALAAHNSGVALIDGFTCHRVFPQLDFSIFIISRKVVKFLFPKVELKVTLWLRSSTP